MRLLSLLAAGSLACSTTPAPEEVARSYLEARDRGHDSEAIALLCKADRELRAKDSPLGSPDDLDFVAAAKSTYTATLDGQAGEVATATVTQTGPLYRDDAREKKTMDKIDEWAEIEAEIAKNVKADRYPVGVVWTEKQTLHQEEGAWCVHADLATVRKLSALDDKAWKAAAVPDEPATMAILAEFDALASASSSETVKAWVEQAAVSRKDILAGFEAAERLSVSNLEVGRPCASCTPVVTGVVHNGGTATVNYVFLVVSVLDSTDSTLSEVDSVVDAETIAPGGSSAFTAMLIPKPASDWGGKVGVRVRKASVVTP